MDEADEMLRFQMAAGGGEKIEGRNTEPAGATETKFSKESEAGGIAGRVIKLLSNHENHPSRSRW